MQDDIQRRILNALLLMLRPLARALLRAGIGYREFEEIAKTAFVDIATSDYGLRGRPTNISRVAVMTGLTRKEVRRLRDKSEAGEGTAVRRSAPMATILHRWYTESEFLDSSGKPKPLKFDGPGVTFSTLVRKYGGDIPPGAMRTELKRIRAIEEKPAGELRAVKRNVTGLDVHEKLIDGLVNTLHPAALNIAHNTDHRGEAWVRRIACTERVRTDDLSRLRRLGADRLTEFSESIDDLFTAYEALHEGSDSENTGYSVGVGVFYFEDRGANSSGTKGSL